MTMTFRLDKAGWWLTRRLNRVIPDRDFITPISVLNRRTEIFRMFDGMILPHNSIHTVPGNFGQLPCLVVRRGGGSLIYVKSRRGWLCINYATYQMLTHLMYTTDVEA